MSETHNFEIPPYDLEQIDPTRWERLAKTLFHRQNLPVKLPEAVRPTFGYAGEVTAEKADFLHKVMNSLVRESLEGDADEQEQTMQQEHALREYVYGEDLNPILETYDKYLPQIDGNSYQYQRVTKIGGSAAHAYLREMGYDVPKKKASTAQTTKPPSGSGRTKTKRKDSALETSAKTKSDFEKLSRVQSAYPDVRNTIIDLLETGAFEAIHDEPTQTAKRLIVMAEAIRPGEKVINIDQDKMAELRFTLQAMIGNEKDRQKQTTTSQANALEALTILTKRFSDTPLKFRSGTIDDVTKTLPLGTTYDAMSHPSQRSVAQSYVAYGLDLICGYNKLEETQKI